MRTKTSTLQCLLRFGDWKVYPSLFPKQVFLAEIRPKADREPSNEPEHVSTAFDGEIFFPKPSNDEQRRIVDKIRAASGVLVQGPPGTGKSRKWKRHRAIPVGNWPSVPGRKAPSSQIRSPGAVGRPLLPWPAWPLPNSFPAPAPPRY